jgi:hypothetical protein
VTIQLCGAAERPRNDFLSKMVMTEGKTEIWDKKKAEDLIH